MKNAPEGAATLSARSTFLERYRAFTVPTDNGLPPARVIGAFFALLAVVGVLLISFAINGTSSGEFYSQVHSGKDPSLLVGQPESIRSDEYNVGVPWTVSQVQQGLPNRSKTFPGGMDVDLPFGLPDHQITMVMEPQLWGFLFLDLNHAYSWKWWLPGLALIGAVFALMVTLVPRRPLVAAGIAIGFYFSPFFQWWYETASLWPIAWGAATLAAIIWALRSTTLRSRIAWAIPLAFITTVMAVGVYAPFMIPVVYVVLFFGVGQVIASKRSGMSWRELLLRLVPIAAAALVAVAAIVAWLRWKAPVVSLFLGTVYPGQRSIPPGNGTPLLYARMIGSSFSESLKNAAGFLGANSSEASTFFLLGVFLVPVAVWIIVRRVRSHGPLPWTTMSLLAVLVFIGAYMVIPGWEPIAHLLFLDLSTASRMIIGIGFASIALVGSIIRDLDRDGVGAPRRLAWIAVGIYSASQLALAFAIALFYGPTRLWHATPAWWLFAALGAAAIFFVARRRPMLGMAAFLVVALATSATVNPVYVGVLDLRATTVGRAIIATNSHDPKSWVGVGGILESSLILESGVTGFNGTQGTPSSVMWAQVDPAHKYSQQWNRLGEVVWTPGKGEPVVTNPEVDVISSTFDACSAFAQKHVGYVLSAFTLSSSCLVKKATFVKPAVTIYEVVQRFR